MQAGQGIKVINKITKDLPNLIEWLNTVTTSERKVEL
jgi:hypothetical protein